MALCYRPDAPVPPSDLFIFLPPTWPLGGPSGVMMRGRSRHRAAGKLQCVTCFSSISMADGSIPLRQTLVPSSTRPTEEVCGRISLGSSADVDKAGCRGQNALALHLRRPVGRNESPLLEKILEVFCDQA